MDSDPNTVNITSMVPLIAQDQVGRLRGFPGHVQRFRISDNARYTADFTPTTDYGSDANTLFMAYSPDGTTVVDSEGATLDMSNGLYTTPRASTFSPDSVGASTWDAFVTDWEFCGGTGVNVVQEHPWTGLTAANLDDNTNFATTGSQTWASGDQTDFVYFDNFPFSDADFNGDGTDYIVSFLEVEIITESSASKFNVRLASWDGTNFDPGTDPSFGTAAKTTSTGSIGWTNANTAIESEADNYISGVAGVHLYFVEGDTNPFTDEAKLYQLRLRLHTEKKTEA